MLTVWCLWGREAQQARQDRDGRTREELGPEGSINLGVWQAGAKLASPCMRAVLFRTNHLLGGVHQAAALGLAALRVET